MNTSQIALLNSEGILSRVATSNSFSKAEMVAHKSQIVDARRAKRERLSTMTGSQLGTLVESQMKDKGAVIKDIRTKTSAKQQTWLIKMVAPLHKSEAERLKAQVVAAGKKLATLEEKLEELNAIKA